MITFRGGVHPNDGKEYTKDKQIEKLEASQEVVFLMKQHIGAPSIPVVKVKDEVHVGTLIAKAGGYVSANIMSSVSGIVKRIEKRQDASGHYQDAVVIENDGNYTSDYEAHENNIDALTFEEKIEKVKNAGVVGLGGAGFPTHVKLNVKEPEKIEYVIVNGAECEPYLTSDYRLMLERSKELVEGLKIMLTLYPHAVGYIGIEDNKKEAIHTLEKLCAHEERISVKVLKTKYPQGGERMWIEVLTGRRLNSKMLPFDVGCIVDNVATVLAIRDAIKYDRPLISTVMTLTGDGLNTPCNVEVLVGTDFQFIVESRGGLKENVKKIISGGPMMGISLISLHIPAVKTSSSILAFTHDEVALNMPTACIRCGRCIDACPSHLIPQKLYQASLKNDINTFIQLNGMECIECGCCSYVCRAKRNMTQAIRKCKSTVTSLKRK